MLRRWILVACASLTALAMVAGCTLDPGLRAIQGDPMASWTPSGMVSEDRYEQGASQESGFYSQPQLARTIQMANADAATDAAIQAKGVAKTFGWREIPDMPPNFLGKSLGGGFRGELYVTLAKNDATQLIISLSD